MPKISAPSVAEHRAAQRAALIAAAEDIVRESGVAGVTPRSVCERTGLSRSSFYDYFPSKDDLLVGVAIAAIESWDAEIEQALEGVAPGLAQLRIFVDATMTMTADGRHEIAGALRGADLSPSRLEDLMVLHDALLRPLVHVLEELGHRSPQRGALLAQGVIGAGVQLVTHGVDPQEAADDVYALLVNGLA
ncbi:TetR/AcrR family transcriptional regulator [Microbacterium paludicola]|uniref:TetR/AcrR family transcriptional regulator n=1 Tax=Microbacterium paludicola TaxID=300019 RepID=UPI0011A8C55B|nr:TetR/AcrR family transcriptional regulator [Microbacterium paludicola]